MAQALPKQDAQDQPLSLQEQANQLLSNKPDVVRAALLDRASDLLNMASSKEDGVAAEAGYYSYLKPETFERIREYFRDERSLDSTMEDFQPLKNEKSVEYERRLAATIEEVSDILQLKWIGGNFARHNLYQLPNPEEFDHGTFEGRRKMEALLKRGGMVDFVEKLAAPYEEKGFQKSYDETREMIESVLINEVMTGHPTNVNSMQRINAMKAMTDAHKELSTAAIKARVEGRELGNEELENLLGKLDRSTVDFLTQRAVPDQSLSVAQETEFGLIFMQRRYDYLDSVYERFDHALSKVYGKEHDAMNFNLDIINSSWVIGGSDKDGNLTIVGEDFLHGAKEMARFAYENYAKELEELKALIGKKPNFDQYNALNKIQEGLDNYNKEPNEFAVSKVDAKLIQEGLQELYKTEGLTEEAKKQVVSFSRHLKAFGAGFGRMEMREGRDEMMETAAALLKEAGIEGFTQRSKPPLTKEENDRNADIISTVLADPAAYDLPGAATRLIENSETPKVVKTNLERFATALSNPDQVDNHVLANTEHVSHILSLQLVKQAMADTVNEIRNNKGQELVSTASLRSTPLYEDPDSLMGVKKRVKELYDNVEHQKSVTLQTAYRFMPDQFKELEQSMKDVRSIEDLYELRKQMDKDLREQGSSLVEAMSRTIEFKIAHSDTSRQSGNPTARILIFHAEKDIREEMGNVVLFKDDQGQEVKGVKPIISQGGSYTDQLRGGMRSISAMIREFELTDVVKMTIQGQDNVMFTNSERDYTRHVEVVAQAALSNILKNERKEHTAKVDPKSKLAAFDKFTEELNSQIEGFLKESAKIGLEAYQENFYKNKMAGKVLAQVYGYHDQHGNVSSRAGKRPDDSEKSGNGSSQSPEDLLAAELVEREKKDNMDMSATRAISYTETVHHNKNYLSFMTTSDILNDMMKQAIEASEDSAMGKLVKELRAEINETIRHPDPGGSLEEKRNKVFEETLLYTLYRENDLLRDVVDRSGFGLLSDFNYSWDKLQQEFNARREKAESNGELDRAKEYDLETYGLSRTEPLRFTRKELEELGKDPKQSQVAMMAWMELEYMRTADLVIPAMTGRGYTLNGETRSEDIRNHMTAEVMPHFKDYVDNVDKAIAQADATKEIVNKNVPDGFIKKMLNVLIHLIEDVVGFGVDKTVNDPGYRKTTQALEDPKRGKMIDENPTKDLFDAIYAQQRVR